MVASLRRLGLVSTVVLLVAGIGVIRLNAVRADNPAPSASATGSAQVTMPWHSFSGGGVIGSSSATHRAGVTAGQGAIGSAAGTELRVGTGFWYGAAGCDCRGIADHDGDGFPTATDLQFEIDIIFFGASDVFDSLCPYTRSDLDCNGFGDATDLAFMIDLVFFGGSYPCVPCE